MPFDDYAKQNPHIKYRTERNEGGFMNETEEETERE